MAVVCIDTQVLVWGIQGVSHPTQNDMIARTTALLDRLAKERARVIVPAVCFGEFLIKIPLDEHPRYQEMVSRKFMVVPFEVRAAVLFAKIWQAKKQADIIAEIKAGGASRSQMRADTMIVATAMANRVQRIYGHDDDIRKLAEGFITFEDIADLELQTTYLPPTT